MTESEILKEIDIQIDKIANPKCPKWTKEIREKKLTNLKDRLRIIRRKQWEIENC